MKDLAYNIWVHESILDCANAGKVDLPLEELQSHQNYIEENKPRVKEYYSTTETPVKIINKKIEF